MAKLTIEELYRGEKYEIMSAVGAQAMKLDIDPQTDEGQTWIEMEYVRQTLIAAEKMKENGDCIDENELADMAAVSMWMSLNADNNGIKQAFPGIDEKYIHRAFRKMTKNKCPENEDSLTWLGKLIVAEILNDTRKTDAN